MTWRIHLSNQAIQQLNILPGINPRLVVWTQHNRARFYDLDNGTFLDDLTLDSNPTADRTSDTWQAFLAHTKGIDSNYYLPFVQTPQVNIYSTDDGKLRVYQQTDDQLFIYADGSEEALDIAENTHLLSVDLDGALGTLAALDDNLQLHIYQQHIRVGTFDIGLQADPDLRAGIVVSRGGSAIYATDGKHIVQVTSGGDIVKTLETHYFIGQIACSPGGGMVITSDMESGVLRVYKGDDLILTHQKFAIDLVAQANQVQLLADLPPAGTALSTITAHNKGILAFAMSGVVCVTHVRYMDDIPRPKTLL
ncbi:MAG: hypothetical protein AAFR81_28340 [Chloroflexota bacterium]